MPMHETFPLDKSDKLLIKCILALMVIITILAFIVCSGCLGINSVDDAKVAALDAISPVVVLKGSAQYEKQYPTETPTPLPTTKPIPAFVTPTPMPTVAAKQVDIYATGERWEKQYYRHITMQKTNQLSTIKKPLDFGIVIYDHKWANSYTWWSDVNGQYYRELPRPGYKFLFVWVHEEVFGDPKTNIPVMPAYGLESFIVQNQQNLYYNDTGYYPVNLILEFDSKPDYYGISRTAPFGFTRIFIGRTSKYGGWIAEKNLDVYIGQGNAHDGYIVYQVPTYATDSNTFLVGNFGTNGNAYWRFDIYAGK